jgi:putative membrane protein
MPLAMMILCFIMMRGHMGWGMGGHRSRHRGESAREILDKRYARGEIGKEEYEEKKRDIGQWNG